MPWSTVQLQKTSRQIDWVGKRDGNCSGGGTESKVVINCIWMSFCWCKSGHQHVEGDEFDSNERSDSDSGKTNSFVESKETLLRNNGFCLTHHSNFGVAFDIYGQVCLY